MQLISLFEIIQGYILLILIMPPGRPLPPPLRSIFLLVYINEPEGSWKEALPPPVKKYLEFISHKGAILISKAFYPLKMQFSVFVPFFYFYFLPHWILFHFSIEARNILIVFTLHVYFNLAVYYFLEMF